MKTINLVLIVVSIILVLGLLSWGVSASWWNNNWQYREQVSVQGGSETLNNFTVLLKVNYDADMQPDFEDLRFVDGACSGSQINALAYEFDKIADLDYALVWVKIPTLNTGNNEMCMYYGNPSALNGENIANAWDYNYVGIWHFKEGSGTITEDSIGLGDGTFTGTPTWTTGKIGDAVSFDGDDIINLDTNTGIKFTDAPFTIESFGYATNFPDHNLASIVAGTVSDGYHFGVDWAPNNLVLATTGGSGETSRASDLVPVNIWKKLTMTYSTSNEINFYQDKIPDSGNPHPYSNIFSAVEMAIGGRNYDYDAWWYGKLDEIRVSNIVRSQAWLNRSYDNVDFNLFSFGGKEYYDADLDGIPSDSDLCPDTSPGAGVDSDGCSASQFCDIFNLLGDKKDLQRKLCEEADWLGNECRAEKKTSKRGPDDCYIERNVKKDVFDDVCAATSNAD